MMGTWGIVVLMNIFCAVVVKKILEVQCCGDDNAFGVQCLLLKKLRCVENCKAVVFIVFDERCCDAVLSKHFFHTEVFVTCFSSLKKVKFLLVIVSFLYFQSI